MVGYLAGRGRSPVFSSNLRLESSIEHTHVGADGQIFTHNDGTGNTDPIVTLNRGGRTFQLLSFTDKYPRTSLASGFLLDPPMEQWEKLLPVVRERDGFVIVLASLPDESAIKMAKDLGKKGVVIRRTQSMPETDIPPNLLGTNSLRGQILGRSDIALDAEGNWSKIESASILLDGRVAPDERVMKLRQDYNSKLEDVEVFRFAEAPPYVRRYAGAEKCGECHVAQMTWWKSSAHAGAMATLEKSQSQFNPDCVSCHVTGYGDYYGFKRHTAKPDLANVQCESCHGIESSMMHGVYTESEWKKEQAVPEGYGEEQWKVVGPAVKKRKQQANRDAFVAGLESTCVTCHTPEHSEGFDFKSYLARMKCPLGLPDVKIIPDPPAAKPAKP